MNTGRLVPLDDIITEEIRADISDSSWEQSKKDGKTLMMPLLSLQNILAYNKELFRECGLHKYLTTDLTIQNWSLEQWEEILDTMADRLPTGKYPVTMYASNNQGDTHIMTLLRSHGGEFIMPDGSFDFTQPKVIEALKWLQQGTDRNWYAPHEENLEMYDNQNLFQDDRLAVYIFNNANFVLYKDALKNFGFVNFPGNLATSFITGFGVFDNGDPKKVQACKDLISYIYNSGELMDLTAGNIPESKKVADKYADQIVMLPQFTANAKNVIDFQHGINNWQGLGDSVRSVFWKEIHALLVGTQTPEETAKRLTEVCNKAKEVDASIAS